MNTDGFPSALIVDDSHTRRRLLGATMRRLGFEHVVEAEHGAEALERLAEHRPTIAMVDWDMPVMGGREFIEAMRADRANDRVRVLVVSSESNARLVLEALRAGADDYATEPITAEIISDKLAMLGVDPVPPFRRGA